MTTSTTARTTAAVLLAARPGGDVSVDDLRLDEIALPALQPGDALIRNALMSLDPNARGRMNAGDMVYTANFEVGAPLDGWAIGEVLDSRSAALPVGSTVRHRKGWRELAVVSESEVARVVDTSLAPSASWLSALGQTGFTAYVGVQRIVCVTRGESVFVSAAAGGVGMIAGQVARLLGATAVIGSAGGPAKAAFLTDALGYTAAIDYRNEDVPSRLRQLLPDGLHAYFDNVGGSQLVAAVRSMRTGGRVALCGMVSALAATSPQPAIDELMDVILRRVTLRGFIVRDHEDLRARFESDVAGWLKSGELTDAYTIADGLAAAPDAFVAMLGGGNTGKALVRVGPEPRAPEPT
jgi:NADPH-dependent curcumin reductase CurA